MVTDVDTEVREGTKLPIHYENARKNLENYVAVLSELRAEPKNQVDELDKFISFRAGHATHAGIAFVFHSVVLCGLWTDEIN